MHTEFLYTLLDSMSVSGYEIELQKKVITELLTGNRTSAVPFPVFPHRTHEHFGERH